MHFKSFIKGNPPSLHAYVWGMVIQLFSNLLWDPCIYISRTCRELRSLNILSSHYWCRLRLIIRAMMSIAESCGSQTEYLKNLPNIACKFLPFLIWYLVGMMGIPPEMHDMLWSDEARCGRTWLILPLLFFLFGRPLGIQDIRKIVGCQIQLHHEWLVSMLQQLSGGLDVTYLDNLNSFNLSELKEPSEAASFGKVVFSELCK